MNNPETEILLKAALSGDTRALARCISIVENDSPGSDQILELLPPRKASSFVIGVTGPPGAGKSSLVNALTNELLRSNPDNRIAILAVDPTSPFTHGSILGDRLRMADHFNNPNVYIRSIATRGNLGGLSLRTPEITDLLLAGNFTHILIETVGVGQSELEIAALADTTLVVFVPESGDEVQTIKSGIMEIGDLFVVNKSDRPGAEKLAKSITTTLHERPHTSWQPPVLLTSAINHSGIDKLVQAIIAHHAAGNSHLHNADLLIEKGMRLLQHRLMKKADTSTFRSALKNAADKPDFNIYRFVKSYSEKH
ncbi:MAG TPA: methylmalonyl Co-A mutase-associated GTPase MeaB [Bacteroidia bacterium]|nr:methylmalonyl Co-A mutase-associated GTPase MeaB [Bacteroidia bacterium]